MPAQSTIERYRDAALALLPPGRAISKDPRSSIGEQYEAAAVEWARADEDAEGILAGIVPGESSDYFAVWEEVLGLPSECVRNPPIDDASRKAAIQLHLLGLYDHSITGYQQAATDLGYGALNVVHYQPALCTGECTQPLYGDGWANVITIVVTGPPNDTLTCIFVDQLRRSHAYVQVLYV